MRRGQDKTKEQLITELGEIRQRVAQFEASEAERVQTEKSPLLSDENYQRLFELFPTGVTVLDMKGVILYCNSAIYSKGGYTEGEFTGKHFSKIAPLRARDIPNFVRIFASLIKGKVPKPFEVNYQHKDGTTGWIELSINLVKMGRKRRILVIQHDINERKRAKEEFENIFNLSPDMVGVFITEGGLIRVNPSWETILGYKTEELLEMGWATLVHPDDVERTNKEVKEQLKGSPVVSFVNRYKCKDGSYKTLEWHATFAKEGIVYATARDITERKLAEKEVLKFKAISDEAGYGVTMNDLEGNLSYVNEPFAGMHGYRPDELIGKHLSIFHNEEQIEDVNRLVEQLRQKGSYIAEEVWHIRKDGTEFPTLMNGTLIRDKKGIPLFTAATVVDITERKQMEEQLELEAQLLDAAVDTILLRDMDGKILYANKTAYESRGYSKDEFIGMNVFSLPTPEDVRLIGSRSKKILEKGEATFESAHFRKDKSVMPIEVHSRIIEKGGQKLYFDIIRDITERRQAEEDLQRAEQNFSNSMDSSPLGIRIITAEGEVLYANQAILDIYGYSSVEELKAAPTKERYAPESYDRYQERKEGRKLGEPVPPDYEISIVRKDGETRHLAAFRKEVLWDGQKQFQTLYRDITEYKKMQAQLIVNDRLASIGELVSGIAHELNNPLTGVIGFSELLSRKKDLPDDVKEDLKVINREAQRTANIVRNLLTFARKQPQEKQPTDINKVIEAVLELRAYEQKVSNIQVDTRFAPDLPEIMANAFDLQQVFLNIIVNAEYAMLEAHGKGTITITTERVGDIIRASLADDGPGISKENLGHVFDPFFTTKEVGKGTGLGLSICYGTITEHGGKIYAESEPGKGATFIVELPTK